jgi:predicted ATPase/class 3 adenylate cyclase
MQDGEPGTSVVTFFFSDIEGSTRLATALGDQWPDALEHHRSVLREAFAGHHGREVGTEGDSFFAVFADAVDAIAAAVEAQRRLTQASEERDAGGQPEMRVRIGLHAGIAQRWGDDYVGLEVHRAARIADGGHGGQILASAAVRALAAGRLGGEITLRPLGVYRLRGFDEPETIFQVLGPSLTDAFPPLALASVSAAHLPEQLSSFVGRTAELQALPDLIHRSRLVTILGPGGTGKTRLALEVGRRVAGEFSHGVWFVDLSQLSDPSLVLATTATALGVREDPARPLIDSLADQLTDRELLLVLDNLEQLLPAAATVAEVLRRLPSLRILVTSRVPLHVAGEAEFHLEPMPVAAPPDDAVAVTGDAIALFVERAQAVDPAFRLDQATTPAVVGIVRRLDGLPLAIELAAAQTRVLAPDELLERLTAGVAILGAAGPDAPDRHRTVESTIDWSYRLLEPAEARLLLRLAVFAGGATLEAADAVANPDAVLGLETLDGLASLVEKSLLVRVPSRFGSRFRMLDTVRAYGLRRLASDDPDGQTARRHAERMLGVADEARPLLTLAGHEDRAERLDLELDNARAALAWAVAHDAPLAMRLCYALWRFWQMRAHFREGEQWCRRALDAGGGQPIARERVMAQLALGNMLYWQVRGEDAAVAYRSAAQDARQLGDDDLLAEALFDLTYPLNLAGHVEEAEATAREALDIYERLGDARGAAGVAVALASARVQAGDWSGARALTTDAHRRYEELGDTFWWATTLYGIALLDLVEGDVESGEDRYRRVLATFDALGDSSSIFFALHGLAWAAGLRGDGARAARLGAAAAQISEAAGAQLPPFLISVPDPIQLAVELVGAEQAAAEAKIGRQMDHDHLIAYANATPPVA